jgi:hypothetical protein
LREVSQDAFFGCTHSSNSAHKEMLFLVNKLVIINFCSAEVGFAHAIPQIQSATASPIVCSSEWFDNPSDEGLNAEHEENHQQTLVDFDLSDSIQAGLEKIRGEVSFKKWKYSSDCSKLCRRS